MPAPAGRRKIEGAQKGGASFGGSTRPGALDELSIPDERTEAERYRIYVRRGGELRLLATTPTAAGIGVALVQLHADAKEAGARLADQGVIGVLDGLERDWIVLPFFRGEIL